MRETKAGGLGFAASRVTESLELGKMMKAMINKVIWVLEIEGYDGEEEKERLMSTNLFNYCVRYKSMVQ